MIVRSRTLNCRHVFASAILGPFSRPSRRYQSLLTLAIETSCDDTSVAVLEKRCGIVESGPRAIIHFHKKITSNNTAYQGVHPIKSLESHQETLASLVNEAVHFLPDLHGQTSHSDLDQANTYACSSSKPDEVGGIWMKRRPDFISVTRGPGMRANLFTGLDTAKGLAVAWQVPLVGVHHMLAHALTPRLVTALQPTQKAESEHQDDPSFPLLSVLISGGHTLIIQSTSLIHHKVLATTLDIAIGECLDKIARIALPTNVLANAGTTMYGALLEGFAFPHGQYPEEDSPCRVTEFGWGLDPPLSKSAGGLKSKTMELSFSGLVTAVERVVRFSMDKSTGKLSKVERAATDVSDSERRAIARESMRAAFDHLASRIIMAIQQPKPENADVPHPSTVVMSGGVAANAYLRHILSRKLHKHGFSDTRIIFPPPQLCTDNAAMIAWAGLEMFQAGYTDPLHIRAIRKWPLDQLLSPPQEC